MTIISFNKELVHPAYQGIIGQMHVSMANKFYEKIEDKDRVLLKKYEKILSPKNFFDRFSFAFDDDRKSRFAAVRKIFYEDKIKDC